MTFWDKVKATGNAVAVGAVSAVKAAETAVLQLREYPTSVQCPSCLTVNPVAPALWDWTCSKEDCKKSNTGAVSACVDCKTAKPSTPNPKVTCTKCSAIVTVPSSNASKLLDDGKIGVRETAKAAKKEIDMLQEKPTQFNCEHCHTLLGVPAPMPWSCAQCKTSNPADAAACTGAGCTVSKPDTAGMVLCGVCNKATKVPANNFLVKVKAEYALASKGLKKLYLDIASKPYILCPRCQTPLHVDFKKKAEGSVEAEPVDKKVDAKSSSDASTTAAGSAVAPIEGEAVSGKAHAEGQSSAVPPTQVAEPQGVEVVCTKCSERLLVAPGATPAGGTTATPAPAVAAATAPAS